MGKIFEIIQVSLQDLAENFHTLMVSGGAKYFTINCFGDVKFWYIGDVREDGTYPCYPTDDEGNVQPPRIVNLDQKVKIYYS